eukprot:SAG31_NODE_20_length_34168_cov_33.651296_19_plen_153_part_00
MDLLDCRVRNDADGTLTDAGDQPLASNLVIGPDDVNMEADNGKAFRHPKQPRAAKKIYTSVLIKRVFDVDTVQQTFGVTLGISMMWKLPEEGDDEEAEEGVEDGPWRCPISKRLYMEKPPDEDEDDGDWDPKWTPKYSFFLGMYHGFRFSVL